MRRKDKLRFRNLTTLRRRLLILIVVSWIVPVTIIFLFMTMSYRNSIINKTERLMEEWLKNFTSLHAQKIDEAIAITKKTSYERTIEKAWKKYIENNISEAELYKEIVSNLKVKYYNDNRFISSVFYLCEEPDRLYYTSRTPNYFNESYSKEVCKEANKITNIDSSDAHVMIINKKIYIIRNLYTTTNYTKFGTLVVELNTDKLFEGISQNNDYEIGFFIGDTESMITYNNNFVEENRSRIINKFKKLYSDKLSRRMFKENDKVYTGLLYLHKYNDYHIGAVLIADKNIIYSELRTLTYIVVLIMMIVIPVFIYMLYFISRHITLPMTRMIKASKELEKGKIGMQIEGEVMPNAEFTVLMDSFNRMSSEVKHLFDYAYNEKLARKEAKIIALQSQINPHFLNNTLEMMNWQARMVGDVVVSKMIEALGTLLDYSMDRTNKKLISLAEELRCADAYFYIISMRFGQRLRVEKEVDPELLQFLVPQLILQPILENAVVHGVESVKSGAIKLHIYREDNNVILQVINTGKNMTEDDIKRVQDILEGKINIKDGSRKHVSLGIRNVNERIKLIYGDDYGLTILPYKDNETSSTITIPYELKDDTDRGKLLKNLLDKPK